MKIKELQKTVNITWSPQQQNPIYLAAGTAAQQLDNSNASATLEIYATNFSDASYDLELRSSVSSQFRFQKLIWSATGYETTQRNGLIVGGCESGHIMIYSAAKMLANEEGLIARQDKHTGPVSGLDINPFQTNLLASCASESEIFIWDLNNTSTHMNPGTKTQPLEDVKNVAWNRQVQHILASVFSTRCVIWDLRKSEQIIKLSDTQSRVRWHAIQWHPEVATQVWLASEDDQAPVVQMWDLRYATAPAKTMQIHQRGILGMSWCPQDSDLMVSCGKDNRIYCWNPNTELPEGEILSEVATTASWYSDVQWCPRNPALIASSSLDGNVSIYSLFGGIQQQVETANKIADSFPGMDQFAQTPAPQQATHVVYEDLKRPPKWIKRPCGVCFGFGGKLLSFNAKSKAVQISQVVTEPEFVERAAALERSLQTTDFSEYCRQRADQMSDQNGRYLWYFLKANFDLSPKEEMLNLLGYNKDDIDQKFSKYNKTSSNESKNLQEIDDLAERVSNQSLQPEENSNTTIDNGINATEANKKENGALPLPQFRIPSGEHPDAEITEALLTGNVEAAVELCMASKRIPEALLIASTAGIEVLTSVQKRVIAELQGELPQVIAALVTCNWLDFIERCTLDSWKEALVATLRHTERKTGDYCERLGDRLLNERVDSIDCTRNAMLCYICAGSIDKFVDAWHQLKRLERNQQTPTKQQKMKTTELQELAELTMVMAKSLELQGIALEVNNKFGDFIKEYSDILASQGALSAALAYIFALGTHEHAGLDELRERIYNAVNHKKLAPTGAGRVGLAPKMPQTQSQNFFAGGQQQQQQQPQSRASFSHTFPAAVYPGGASVMPAQQQPMQSQFNNNATWAAPPPPPTNAVPPPNIFNPAASMASTVNAKPPLQTFTNDTANMSQPPRPLSTSSSQGGLHARSKYVLDPSVAAPTAMGSMGGGYGAPLYAQTDNAPAMPMPTMPAPTFNPTPFANAGNFATNTSSMMQPSYNAAATQQNAPPPPLQNIQRNPTPPPGWNDPPALKSTRQVKKTETPAAAAAPITHPLFGVDPNQNQNGYMDPNSAYQQHAGSMMSTQAPPPPPTSGGQTGMMNIMQPTQPIAGAYPNAMAHNNNPQYQTQTQFQTTFLTNQQQQQPQMNSYNEQQQQPMQPVQRKAEAPPKEKPPLPEEFIYMQTVLEELKNQCLAAATDARTKRKFVDVAKRLENLYDCLRDGRLTTATLAALNQIIQFIQVGDYANALQTQTQIAFGSDFSQCAGFMPGLKVLVQSATDLQVYLR